MSYSRKSAPADAAMAGMPGTKNSNTIMPDKYPFPALVLRIPLLFFSIKTPLDISPYSDPTDKNSLGNAHNHKQYGSGFIRHSSLKNNVTHFLESVTRHY